ncbi:MAG TPA: cupin domain-containing protein [Verrucomicrobiae bacterium]|jgi:mannose-6-phosphate isomerase-like protein (cupin superfamily)|nr:cupin domain-containing protein [Verrucomicrobiae bacterium]
MIPNCYGHKKIEWSTTVHYQGWIGDPRIAGAPQFGHPQSKPGGGAVASGRSNTGATQEHYHVWTEEIYYITHGIARIRVDGEIRDVKAGDAIAILPGQKHKLWNTGKETLRLLCCCAPAYEHTDTVITETPNTESH